MSRAPLTLAPHPDAPRSVDADAQLVSGAQAGDRKAFAVLFQKHHGRIQAMCTRLLADPTEVEDAVQQTFLEAWRCLDRFEGRSLFTSWLTRVAIHTCFSTRRRLRRLLLSTLANDDDRGGSSALPVWSEPDLSADEVASRRARERAVQEILASLSSKKRAVFVLADLQGMTSTEIAEILEIPDATVRTRLFHARREMAERVRGHPGFVDMLPSRVGCTP